MAVIRVMPDGVDRDLKKLEEGLKAALPGSAKIQSIQVKPFAFGLKALSIAVLVTGSDPSLFEGRFRK